MDERFDKIELTLSHIIQILNMLHQEMKEMKQEMSGIRKDLSSLQEAFVEHLQFHIRSN